MDIPSPRSYEELPQLEGKRVALRPVFQSDYDFLYVISTRPETLVRWRFRGATPSPEQFAASLWQGVVAQFMIVRPGNGDRVGLITAYNANPRSGTAFVAVIVAPEYERLGWTMDAITLFLRYLFRVGDFRKLYIETLEFNFARFGKAAAPWYHVEGCLKDHELQDGRYWHLYYLAVYRDEWLESAKRLLPYVLGERPPRDDADIGASTP